LVCYIYLVFNSTSQINDVEMLKFCFLDQQGIAHLRECFWPGNHKEWYKWRIDD